MICKFTFHCSNVCSREEGKSCPAFTMRPMDLGAASEYNRAPNVAIGSSWSVLNLLHTSRQDHLTKCYRATRNVKQCFLARCANLVEPDTSECHECGTGMSHLVPHRSDSLQVVRVVACSDSITTTFFEGKVEPMRVNVAVEGSF